MKQISSRALFAYFMVGAFLIGLLVFLSSYVTKADDWALYPANPHLYSDGKPLNFGSIYDNEGTALAETADGARNYNENSDIRRATMHLVGDQDGYVSTGLQVQYARQLAGYNFFTGTHTLQNRGNDIYSTVNAQVNLAALYALDGRKGTVGVYNYKTGEILCMVSTPTFDPLDPPVLSEDADDSSYDGVYLNRFLSASYTPGSTFKLVTAAAAIDTIPDIYSQTFHCDGYSYIDGQQINCTGVHGDIDFNTALAVSCNPAFAQISLMLSPDILTEYAENMGFNHSFKVSGTPLKQSAFDISGAGQADMAWAGIGQYTDLANPCQMMITAGAIANGGVPVQPYYIEKIESAWGIPVSTGKARSLDRMLSESTANILGDMMRNNVTSNYGDWQFPDLEVCAKTGTAEVDDGEPHAWAVGFVRNESLPLAFVVTVENAGFGMTNALPVANTVLQSAREHIKY